MQESRDKAFPSALPGGLDTIGMLLRGQIVAAPEPPCDKFLRTPSLATLRRLRQPSAAQRRATGAFPPDRPEPKTARVEEPVQNDLKNRKRRESSLKTSPC